MTGVLTVVSRYLQGTTSEKIPNDIDEYKGIREEQKHSEIKIRKTKVHSELQAARNIADDMKKIQ